MRKFMRQLARLIERDSVVPRRVQYNWITNAERLVPLSPVSPESSGGSRAGAPDATVARAAAEVRPKRGVPVLGLLKRLGSKNIKSKWVPEPGSPEALRPDGFSNPASPTNPQLAF